MGGEPVACTRCCTRVGFTGQFAHTWSPRSSPTSASGPGRGECRVVLRAARRRTAPGAPRAIHRVTPVIMNLGYQPIGQNEVAVRMGDLESSNPASVVLDLMVPPRAAGSFRIAQAELHYTPLQGTGEQVLKQDILLEFTTNEQAAQFNPRVMNLVEKVTAFKLQTRALSEVEAGNHHVVPAVSNPAQRDVEHSDDPLA